MAGCEAENKEGVAEDMIGVTMILMEIAVFGISGHSGNFQQTATAGVTSLARNQKA